MNPEHLLLITSIAMIILIPLIAAVIMFCCKIALKFAVSYKNTIIVTAITTVLGLIIGCILHFLLGADSTLACILGFVINLAIQIYFYANMLKNKTNETLGYGNAIILAILVTIVLLIISFFVAIFAGVIIGIFVATTHHAMLTIPSYLSVV